MPTALNTLSVARPTPSPDANLAALAEAARLAEEALVRALLGVTRGRAHDRVLDHHRDVRAGLEGMLRAAGLGPKE